ncbi:uncharacterized protein LOC131328051 isoform X2 [Rhododendron vialii]|uniref:uncharacterized protein LOC131328051 isoform X2 n=1 Tax=Rhododendron vialii TaxID=182163 RepID=UPI00265E6209|nr:uncharacterized protein LOC131328051 isoform X2 [Rhododendron vialii]
MEAPCAYNGTLKMKVFFLLILGWELKHGDWWWGKDAYYFMSSTSSPPYPFLRSMNVSWSLVDKTNCGLGGMYGYIGDEAALLSPYVLCHWFGLY